MDYDSDDDDVMTTVKHSVEVYNISKIINNTSNSDDDHTSTLRLFPLRWIR